MRSKATRWPNGLGWDVKTRHGIASVAILKEYLSVSVPISPVYEQIDTTTGIKSIKTDRRKLCRVPIYCDIRDALQICRDGGIIVEGYDLGENIPFLDATPHRCPALIARD